MTIYGRIDYVGHLHRLRLEIKEEGYICNACKEVGSGRRYACEEGSCDFHLHKECANPPQIATHRFFPNRVFEYTTSNCDGTRFCDACGIDILGHSYTSGSRKRKDMHPRCALAFEHEYTMGDVKLFLKKVLSSKCEICRSKKPKNNFGSWGYVSEDKEIQVHLFCVMKNVKEKLEITSLDDTTGEVNGGDYDDELALVVRNSEIQTEVHGDEKKKKRGGKYAKVKKVLQVVITLIIGALVGDPTSMLVGAFTSVVSLSNFGN